MNIEAKRDVPFPAPAKHISPWALNPAYVSRDGLGMVMSLSFNDSHGLGSKNWTKWTDTIQRFVSQDNGATWSEHGPRIEVGSFGSGCYQHVWQHFLDPDNGLLLGIFTMSEKNPGEAAKRTSLHYEISRDAGRTWMPARQVIHPGQGFDSIHWMPGIVSGKQHAGADQGPFARLDDGTILFGFAIASEDMPYGVAFLRGRWADDLSHISWDVSDIIRVPRTVSASGVCEPDLLHLGGQRLLTTMRCQGIKGAGVPSTRQWSLSEDGGRTWSAPQPLRYDDGSMVCVPASLAAFEKEPATGRAFWFANILSHPVTGQIPRYPLTIAELHTQRLCLIKDSVTVIQDLPGGAIKANEDIGELGRRYSNFGHYVDRVTGEFVLMMAEEPKIDWDDYTSDCIRFRVRL